MNHVSSSFFIYLFFLFILSPDLNLSGCVKIFFILFNLKPSSSFFNFYLVFSFHPQSRSKILDVYNFGCVKIFFFISNFVECITDTIHPICRENRQTDTAETDIRIWAETDYDIPTVGWVGFGFWARFSTEPDRCPPLTNGKVQQCYILYFSFWMLVSCPLFSKSTLSYR